MILLYLYNLALTTDATEPLDLSHNDLGDLGVTMIARYASTLDSLTTLNLTNNHVTALGIYMVDEALKSVGKPDDFYI
ncbi:hypothetical protein N9N97_02890 [Rickettsiaceae bacterium]|nr:hypothetical protein [Rickettsiaceae bacterium]